MATINIIDTIRALNRARAEATETRKDELLPAILYVPAICRTGGANMSAKHESEWLQSVSDGYVARIRDLATYYSGRWVGRSPAQSGCARLMSDIAGVCRASSSLTDALAHYAATGAVPVGGK